MLAARITAAVDGAGSFGMIALDEAPVPAHPVLTAPTPLREDLPGIAQRIGPAALAAKTGLLRASAAGPGHDSSTIQNGLALADPDSNSLTWLEMRPAARHYLPVRRRPGHRPRWEIPTLTMPPVSEVTANGDAK